MENSGGNSPVNVSGVLSSRRAMSLSEVNGLYPWWLIIFLTVLAAPELILVKLTSPAYTLQRAGSEDL